MTQSGGTIFAALLAGAALSACTSGPQWEPEENRRARAEGVALADAWQPAYGGAVYATTSAPVVTRTYAYSGYVAPTWTAPSVRYATQKPWPVYVPPAPGYVVAEPQVVYVAPATRTITSVGTSSPVVTWTPPAAYSSTYVASAYVPPVYVPSSDRIQRIRDLDARIDVASTRITDLRVRTVRTSRYDERLHALESIRDAARQDVTAMRDASPARPGPTFDEAEVRVRTLEAYVDSEGRAIAEGR